MGKIIFNQDGTIDTPDIILCKRNLSRVGVIGNVSNLQIVENLNSANEISFTYTKCANGVVDELWNNVTDIRIVEVKNFGYFEIQCPITEQRSIVKNISGKSLCDSELSQILCTLEVNTEDDIARDDYDADYPTVFYRDVSEVIDETIKEKMIKSSLMDRILTYAPHYSIGHIDECLCNVQKTFSTSDTYVYNFLIEVAEEMNCIFVFNGKTRSISAYNLDSDRGDVYGKTTSIFVDSENLGTSLTCDSSTDKIKNCFKVIGGDDIITSTISGCNPNGSNRVWNFSEFQKDDMSDELVLKLEDYQDAYDAQVDTYSTLLEDIYDLIDDQLYYESGMMPTVVTSEKTTDEVLANLETEIVIEDVATTTPLSSVGKTVAGNAVLAMAKIYMESMCSVEIVENSDSYNSTTNVWSGKFRVHRDSDESESISVNNIDITISNDTQTCTEQKIQKLLYDDETPDWYQETDWTLYSLNRLSSFSDAYQSCLDILESAGYTTNYEDDGITLTLRGKYYNEKVTIDQNILIREGQLDNIQSQMDVKYSQRDAIQSDLNIESYLGTTLYKELCSFKREDVYNNSNYVSDGLDNAEQLDMAKKLLEVANKEILKSSNRQYSISSTINNLLCIKGFESIRDDFELGNFIRVKVDDNIAKLRLISMSFNFNSINEINVTYSDNVDDTTMMSDAKSVFSQTQSMAMSYDCTKRQADKGNSANEQLKSVTKNGLDASKTMIANSKNQEFTVTKHGALAREYLDETQAYSPKQLKIVKNMIAMTDDNWKTVRSAFGEDSDGNYGLIADCIVGKMITGDKLVIGNDNYTLNEDGINIKVDGEDKNIVDITSESLTDFNTYYALSDSPTTPPTSGWSTTAPEWDDGKYMWQKTTAHKSDGTFVESDATCIQGSKGSDGENGQSAYYSIVTSSQGETFKSDTAITSTTLSCQVYYGSTAIEPLSYTWKKLTDDNTTWETIGTNKTVTIALGDFIVRNRIKCIFEI